MISVSPRNHSITAALLLLSASLLGACAHMGTGNRTTAPEMVREDYCDAEDIAAQAVRARALKTAELASEAETLNKAYIAQRSNKNRLKLGVFLALAPNPYTDRSRALALLDPTGEPNKCAPPPITTIMIPMLQETRRLEDQQLQQQRQREELNAAQQKLRDELNTTQQKLRDEQKRADIAQQNADNMRQKLEAIRDIEKKMLERNPPTTKSP